MTNILEALRLVVPMAFSIPSCLCFCTAAMPRTLAMPREMLTYDEELDGGGRGALRTQADQQLAVFFLPRFQLHPFIPPAVFPGDLFGREHVFHLDLDYRYALDPEKTPYHVHGNHHQFISGRDPQIEDTADPQEHLVALVVPQKEFIAHRQGKPVGDLPAQQGGIGGKLGHAGHGSFLLFCR